MDYNKVIQLVEETKDIVLNNDNLKVKLKGKADFVTKIDTDISNFLKNELGIIDSCIDFFSEEEEGLLTDNCWILDPIDGTTNLVYGYNFSSVSLAHYVSGEVVFGVVYNPFNGEIFTAEKGKGAFLNRKEKIQVSNRKISESLIEFGAGSTHKENLNQNFQIAKELFEKCLDIRRMCSSALVLCYISAGRIDGYFERVLKPWDFAAASLILTEAGGHVTNYFGEKLDFTTASSIVATNGIIHNCLQDVIIKNSDMRGEYK